MPFKAGSKEIDFSTGGNDEVVDLTGGVAKAVAEFGLKEGTVTVFAVGSTAAITTLEFEPGLEADIKVFLRDIAPAGDWRHNATWGDGNGHSHIRASLIGPSVTIPVTEGKLALGTWQQVVCIDNDIRGRSRRVILQMTGETT
ncbi:MAG: secondary thiamine-phosphate synthase enzyme YjbQ [Actinomycetota bacterium]